MLRDVGLVAFDEPFKRLLTQGMVLKNGAVMSKSKGNVVDPDDMIGKYGADTLRLYTMFVAPPEKKSSGAMPASKGVFASWSASGGSSITGRRRSVGRLPACGPDCTDAERALRRKTHDTIRRVTSDIEDRMHLNTAVSSLMELVNELYTFSQGTAHGAPTREEPRPGRVERSQTVAVLREAIDALVIMVSPFAPHTAEELWHMLGNPEGLTKTSWPSFDAELARAEEVVVPVQVNGKVRARLTVPVGLSDEALQAAALADPAVKAHADGRTIRKVVVAKGPLVSVVVS